MSSPKKDLRSGVSPATGASEFTLTLKGASSTAIVWDLNQTTYGDNGNSYSGKSILPTSGFGDNVAMKMWKRIVFTGFTSSADDDETLQLAWNADGIGQAVQSVSFIGLALKVDDPDAIVDLVTVGGDNYHMEAILDLGQPARRLGINFSNATVGDDFYVTSAQIDAKPLGRRPTPSITSQAQ